jgi:aminoglycoside phosphotransferase (APT) family kinase protein
MFREVRQRAEGRAIPLVWQHNDFGTWNVRRSGTHISVIDWEVSRRGLAVCDLLYFVTHWSQLVQGLVKPAEQQRDVQRLFGPSRLNSRIAAVHEALDTYLRDLELDRRIVPLLLVYTFAEQALDRVQRLRALHSPESATGLRPG